MKKILVIAPHNDDETLGAGGTIAKCVSRGDSVHVAVFTSIAEGHPVLKPNRENIRAETRSAMEILGVPKSNVIFEDLPNVLVPDTPVHEVNRTVMRVIERVRPDVILLPFLNDLHKDHREIVYAVQVAARTCTPVGRGISEIYMYETLSETHWNMDQVEGGFLPNVYNDITDFLETKVKAVKAYRSQLKKFPEVRSVEAIRALAVLRGAIAGMPAAEAFMLVRKLNV